MELKDFCYTSINLKNQKFERNTLKHHLALLAGKVRSGKNITGNLFTKRNILPISSGRGVFKDYILFLIMCMWICLCFCVWAYEHVCRCPYSPELLNNPQAD